MITLLYTKINLLIKIWINNKYIMLRVGSIMNSFKKMKKY